MSTTARPVCPGAVRASTELSKRGSKRRTQVRAAALELFARLGYEGTTVSDICHEVGVGKGVFYWYFESKASLFAELLGDLLDDLVRAQRAGRDVATPAPARLEGALRASLRFLAAHPELPRLRVAALRSREFALIVERTDRVLVAGLAEAISEGIAEESVRNVDPALGARAILAAVFCVADSRGDDETRTASTTEIEDALTLLFLAGLLSMEATSLAPGETTAPKGITIRTMKAAADAPSQRGPTRGIGRRAPSRSSRVKPS